MSCAKENDKSISLERRREHDEDEVGDDAHGREASLIQLKYQHEISPVNIVGIDKGAKFDPGEIIITVNGEVNNGCENTSVPSIG